MGNLLRDRRTPQEFAASGQIIEINNKISNFKRLDAIVEKELCALDTAKMPQNWRDATVTGEIRFGFADAQRSRPVLRGDVAVTIDAVCQRCLDPMRLPLTVELNLLLDAGQATVAADDEFEVWELTEDRLRPLDIIEESLIMAMPFAAMHADCANVASAEPEAGEKLRPFASLKRQMKSDT